MSKGNNARENAMLLDPNRQKIAKQMTTLPGGPENNNPMNVTDNASPQVQSDSIYGDYKQNYPQMGTGMVNPMGVQRSQIPGNMPVGQKQNAMPFGAIQQPNTAGSAPDTDGMESGRLFQSVQMAGLPAGAMGFQGMGPVGEFPPAMPNTMGQPLMPGMQSAEMAAGNGGMTPGSTPQKINKKGKRTA